MAALPQSLGKTWACGGGWRPSGGGSSPSKGWHRTVMWEHLCAPGLAEASCTSSWQAWKARPRLDSVLEATGAAEGFGAGKGFTLEEDESGGWEATEKSMP